MVRKSSEIIEVNAAQMEELLDRATSNTLREQDTELMRQIFASYSQFFEIVGDKNTSIARLRKLMFGSQTEKTKKVVKNPPVNDDANHESSDGDSRGSDETTVDSAESPDDAATDDSPGTTNRPTSSSTEPDENKRSGHGRYGANDYSGADQVDIKHPTLSPGDACPECVQGTVYEKVPSAIVRIVGQAPLGATVYRMQRLRCHLCGKSFTAPTPKDAGDKKYDVTAASMIGLLKYGSGLPFNRLERLQRSCEIPLAASTQWEIVEAAASMMLPAYDELIRQAAQGEVVHNDDTYVRILELMGEQAQANAISKTEDDSQDPARTGLFTSGVMSTRDGVRMALFFSGRRHAGENLTTVLKLRAAELDAPIQMCDGLSRNLPRELETIVANCLVHARRKFVEVYDRFTDECRHVIETLSEVYRHDQFTSDNDMSHDERLAHHQVHSKPIMDELHAWLRRQLDEKIVEPNSGLGDAINYMLKRWGRLTTFLRKPGAPLDNNTCERLLKKSILHRKNAMFYKTQNGAHIGDLYMSLIYTCELAGTNAYEYLTQLQIHSKQVARTPQQWMPWNYKSNIPGAKNAA